MNPEYFESCLEPELDFVAVKFASEILRELPFPSSATKSVNGFSFNQFYSKCDLVPKGSNLAVHIQDALRCFDSAVCDVVGTALSNVAAPSVIFNCLNEGPSDISEPLLDKVLEKFPNCLKGSSYNRGLMQPSIHYSDMNHSFSSSDNYSKQINSSNEMVDSNVCKFSISDLTGMMKSFDPVTKSRPRPTAIVSPMMAVQTSGHRPNDTSNEQNQSLLLDSETLAKRNPTEMDYTENVVKPQNVFTKMLEPCEINGNDAGNVEVTSDTQNAAVGERPEAPRGSTDTVGYALELSPDREKISTKLRKKTRMVVYNNPELPADFSPELIEQLQADGFDVSVSVIDKSTYKPATKRFIGQVEESQCTKISDQNSLENEKFKEEMTLTPPKVKRASVSSSGSHVSIKKRNVRNYSDLDDDPTQCVSFKQFSITLDAIIEESANSTFSVLSAEEAGDLKVDFLIPRKCLDCLYIDSAQLKSLDIMCKIELNKLIKLLNLLSVNVRSGIRLMSTYCQEKDEDHEEEKACDLLVKDCLIYYADSVSIILNVLVSKSMSREIYVEELIELIASYARSLLNFTIWLRAKSCKQTPKGRKISRKYDDKVNSVLQVLCNRAVEILFGLSHIVTLQRLSDTIILMISSLSIRSFFSEDLNELQFASLKCLKTVFAFYPNHRDQILNEIFSSVIRLAMFDKKTNIVETRASYKFTCGTSASVNIQKLTALIIHLVQGHAWLSEDYLKEQNKEAVIDKLNSVYDDILSTSKRLLTALLSKCGVKQSEDDFRPVFDAFVQDLLVLLHRPECPAAEVLVSHLSTALVSSASSRSNDVSMRVFSLDHLGHIAAQLRRGMLKEESHKERLNLLLQKIMDDKIERGGNSSETIDDLLTYQSSFIQFLNHACKSEDISLKCARNFYIIQWIHDLQNGNEMSPKAQKHESFFKKCELFELMNSPDVIGHNSLDSSFYSKSLIDYDEAILISQYLHSKRPLSNSFDIYMKKISAIFLSSDNATQVRTKALKCVTHVIETDPSILLRADVQLCVQESFVDRSVSVREAAADLVGRYVTNDKHVALQYYKMLCDRILDTGVSVRKRVIKVFHEIVVNIPDFPQIPDICVRILKRLHDEIGIKKLVHDTMRSLWFTPSSNASVLQTRAESVANVISAFGKCSIDHFELLLNELISDEKITGRKELNKAVSQLIDCLVDRILKDEATIETSCTDDQMKWVANFQGIYVLGKVFPQYMIKHAQTLFTYLNFECSANMQLHIIYSVAKTLEYAVPLMSDPSQKFIYSLENSLIKLIIMKGTLVISGCLACLSSVINGKSKNYKLARDFMQSFFETSISLKHEFGTNNRLDENKKPMLFRALYVLGLFGKLFDLESPEMISDKICSKQDVFDVLVYFCSVPDEVICIRALEGLGFFLSRYAHLMTGKVIRDLYYNKLKESSSTAVKCQILKNLEDVFKEEENRLVRNNMHCVNNARKDVLADLNDVQLGQSSTIAQIFIRQMLETYMTPLLCIRQSVVNVVDEIISFGLIHPIQCYPYLIAMSADTDAKIKIRCQSLLLKFDKGYPSMSHAKALEGIKMSFKLHSLLHTGCQSPRGFTVSTDLPSSLNSFIYTIIRSNKAYRRSFLLQLLKLFQEDSTVDVSHVSLLLFIADNLAYFPYQLLDEVLFIIQEIDLIVSVSGPNLIHSFAELLNPVGDEQMHDLENLTMEDIITQLPDNLSTAEKFLISSQGCILLLLLRKFFKQFYGIIESKIAEYDRSKVFERQLCVQKATVRYDPVIPIDKLTCFLDPNASASKNEERSVIAANFLELRKLIDNVDVDSLETELVDAPYSKNEMINESLVAASGIYPGVSNDSNNVNHFAKKKIVKGAKKGRKPLKRRKLKHRRSTDSDELEIIDDDDEDYIP